MSANAPLVSVIVPVHNGAATLERTLRSIAAQSYERLEIIIVDDGSTDGSAELAAGFCATEPRARLLTQANAGVAAARNAGIAAATGPYCAPIDADDLWHERKIERQVAALRSAPEPPAFVYCWFRHIDGQDEVWRDGPAFAVDGRALQRHLYCNFVGNGSAPLFPRAAALAVGGYDERLRDRGAQGCEDLLLQLRLARHGPVACVPEFLVGYRFGPSSMSDDFLRMRASWREALRIFAGEEGQISPRLARWNAGRRALAEAETAALRKRFGRAAGLLMRAIIGFPTRTGFVLACRIARRIRRRQPETAPGRFDALDPGVAIPPDRWLAAIHRFDERKLRRIEVLEA